MPTTVNIEKRKIEGKNTERFLKAYIRAWPRLTSTRENSKKEPVISLLHRISLI
jgi:hypothetical protein